MLAKDASRACLSGILSQNFQSSVGNDRALFFCNRAGRAGILSSQARPAPNRGKARRTATVARCQKTTLSGFSHARHAEEQAYAGSSNFGEPPPRTGISVAPNRPRSLGLLSRYGTAVLALRCRVYTTSLQRLTVQSICDSGLPVGASNSGGGSAMGRHFIYARSLHTAAMLLTRHSPR
jgi:hypothetical protein